MSDRDTITLPREVVEKIHEAWSSEVYPAATSTEWYDIMDALRTALAAPRLEVTVDPRLTAEEAAAISAAIDARKKEQSEDIEALRRDAEKWRKARAKYIAWQKGGKAEAMEDKT